MFAKICVHTVCWVVVVVGRRLQVPTYFCDRSCKAFIAHACRASNSAGTNLLPYVLGLNRRTLGSKVSSFLSRSLYILSGATVYSEARSVVVWAHPFFVEYAYPCLFVSCTLACAGDLYGR